MKTRPIGLSFVPPVGPAIPVVDKAISTLVLFNNPSAIAKATSLLTAPRNYLLVIYLLLILQLWNYCYKLLYPPI